jgi:hypothetical protein
LIILANLGWGKQSEQVIAILVNIYIDKQHYH